MSVRSLKVYIWFVNIMILLGVMGVTYLFFTKILAESDSLDGELDNIIAKAMKEVKLPNVMCIQPHRDPEAL